MAHLATAASTHAKAGEAAFAQQREAAVAAVQAVDPRSTRRVWVAKAAARMGIGGVCVCREKGGV